MTKIMFVLYSVVVALLVYVAFKEAINPGSVSRLAGFWLVVLGVVLNLVVIARIRRAEMDKARQ